MASATIKVHGLREVNAAFGKIDKQLRKELGNDLKKAAEPVVVEAKALQVWRGASISTIRAKRRGLGVFVEQTAKKKTGKRGDYGALQMRKSLEPALEEKADEVFDDVEETLNRYAHHAGF